MKRGNHSKSRASKGLVLILAMVLLVGAAIGGTVAWLTDQTQEVENTFTVGNIDIELAEDGATDNKRSFKMIPGDTLAKKPYVTVKATSEPCWVFVEVTEENPTVTGKNYTFGQFIDYSVDNAIWKELDATEHPGVYYMDLSTITTADTAYDILTNDQVTVEEDVTKAMMDDLQSTGATLPKLIFKAYAIQQSSFATADDGWHELKNIPAH